MSDALLDEVAFVTGGGRGLGQAIAEALAGAGAAVIVAARSGGEIASVADSINAAGGRAIAVTCDVVDGASVEAAFAQARQAFGAPTILVNNAGIQGPLAPIGVADVDAWWQTQQVHILGALRCMHVALGDMVSAGRGRIINVASQAGTFVAPNASAYAVAKASLIRLTEHVDAERRAQGIRAFAIQPGTIHTDMAAKTLASESAREHAGQLVALLESVTAEDSDRARAKLQALVVDISTGRFDALAGRYIDVDWDLPAMAKSEAAA